MKKLISLMMALTMTVGFCAMSLYAYSYKTALNDFGVSLKDRFVKSTSREMLSDSMTALSNFFIARPRAYLRQHGALSGAPDAIATAGQTALGSGQGEPMNIDRVPITARLQIVYMPERVTMSFSTKSTGATDRHEIATIGRINDS